MQGMLIDYEAAGSAPIFGRRREENVPRNATSYRLNVHFGGGGLVIRSAFTLSDIGKRLLGKRNLWEWI